MHVLFGICLSIIGRGKNQARIYNFLELKILILQSLVKVAIDKYIVANLGNNFKRQN